MDNLQEIIPQQNAINPTSEDISWAMKRNQAARQQVIQSLLDAQALKSQGGNEYNASAYAGDKLAAMPTDNTEMNPFLYKQSKSTPQSKIPELEVGSNSSYGEPTRDAEALKEYLWKNNLNKKSRMLNPNIKDAVEGKLRLVTTQRGVEYPPAAYTDNIGIRMPKIANPFYEKGIRDKTEFSPFEGNLADIEPSTEENISGKYTEFPENKTQSDIDPLILREMEANKAYKDSLKEPYYNSAFRQAYEGTLPDDIFNDKSERSKVLSDELNLSGIDINKPESSEVAESPKAASVSTTSHAEDNVASNPFKPEQDEGFKINPFKSKRHFVGADSLADDKYLRIGNHFGTLAGKAMVENDNRGIDEYNENEKARREQFNLDHQLEREAKQDAKENAAALDFIDAEDYITPGLDSNWQRYITDPSTRAKVKNLLAVMKTSTEYNANDPMSKRKAHTLLLAKQKAKTELDKIFASNIDNVLDLGESDLPELGGIKTVSDYMNKKDTKEYKYNEALTDNDMPFFGGVKDRLNLIGANVSDTFNITDHAKEVQKNVMALKKFKKKMPDDFAGYVLDSRRTFTKNSENLNPLIKRMMGPNDVAVNIYDKITGAKSIVLIKNGQMVSVEGELLKKSNDDNINRLKEMQTLGNIAK